VEILVLLKECCKKSRFAKKCAKIKCIYDSALNLLILILTIIIAYYTYQIAEKELKPLNEKANTIIETDIQNEFVILSPVNGDAVSEIDTVAGKTPYLNLNNYIVITALAVGQENINYVQEGPLQIFHENGTGTWIAKAHFGASEKGIGEKFMVRCMATKEIIDVDSHNTVIPKDAI